MPQNPALERFALPTAAALLTAITALLA
jgi:hypothetical protein